MLGASTRKPRKSRFVLLVCSRARYTRNLSLDIYLLSVLTLGYKKSLLSSLVPIRYEDTIDSMYDLDKSGLPVIMAKGTAGVKHMREDPGTMMARIFKRRILFTVVGGSIPGWVFERYKYA